MEKIEFSAKTVDEAIMKAQLQLDVSSENMEYEVIEKESKGILGFINAKPAKILAWKKETVEDRINSFLNDVFSAMNLQVTINMNIDEEEGTININLVGDDMGVLIGKRGQTLDSLQYLVSLVANKESSQYYRVKLDTENYREEKLLWNH